MTEKTHNRNRVEGNIPAVDNKSVVVDNSKHNNVALNNLVDSTILVLVQHAVECVVFVAVVVVAVVEELSVDQMIVVAPHRLPNMGY
ncbi:MAG TPA: hypothetical protein VNX68_06835 [Nitrosopumilaceae archaeon]|jgi:hypothetical protein|nr:hypothetical protein [Nitrosopumilaceae archaeon]